MTNVVTTSQAAPPPSGEAVSMTVSMASALTLRGDELETLCVGFAERGPPPSPSPSPSPSQPQSQSQAQAQAQPQSTSLFGLIFGGGAASVQSDTRTTREVVAEAAALSIEANDLNLNLNLDLDLAAAAPKLRKLRLRNANVSTIKTIAKPAIISHLALEDSALALPNALDLINSDLGMSMLEAVASNPTVFTHLSLARNNLLSLSPDLTPLFSNLVLLDLSGNRLSSFPSHLHSLPHLRFLNLNKNQLTSVSVKLPDTRSSASSISSRSSAASKSNLIDRSPVFHMLTHLSISENSVEVIGDLSTVFPLLVSLNLSSNNILDVFEIKGCSVLDSLSELQVAGNPISRLASHRMNIFTYFKTKALSLKIDGALPTSAENKEILAGLTIAATTATTITSSKPAIISSTSAHHSAKVDMSSSVSDLSLGKKGAPRHSKKGSGTRRAIAIVQDVPIPSPLQDVEPSQPPPPIPILQQSSNESLTPTANTPTQPRATFTGSQTASPSKPLVPQQILGVDVTAAEDLTMESMDSESSRATSPVHGLPTSPRLPSNLKLPQQGDRSFSRYFDAQQEFLSASSSSDDDSSSPIETRKRTVSSGVEEGTVVVGGTEVSPILDGRGTGDGAATVVDSPKREGKVVKPSPLRSGSRLDRIEQSVASASESGVATRDSGFMKRGPIVLGGSAAAGARRGVLGVGNSHQFEVTADSMQSPLSSSPLSNTGFSKLLNATDTAASLAPPSNQSLNKKASQTEWHKKMAAVHEQARKEAQQIAEEEEKRALSVSTNTVSHAPPTSGFHEQAAAAAHLPPQKPLMDTAAGSIASGSSGKRGGVEGIGPYRRVYDFEPTTGAARAGEEESVRSLRSVHVTYVEGGEAAPVPALGRTSGLGIGGGQPGLARSFNAAGTSSMRDVGRLGASRRDDGLVGGSGELAPRLVLSRPVTNSNIYNRRRGQEDSEAGSERSGSVYSAYPTRRGRGGGTIAGSMFSGESGGGFSVFSGMTSMSRVSGMPLPLPHRQVSPTALVFPRSPNIPFLEINNSLQLHLKFKVFSNDQEKILTWVGGSVVAQVSPYLQGIAANASANASANDSFISSFLSSSSNSSTSSNQQDPRVAATIERMQTVERASYLLLTDKALYIFTPTFAMPYDPFSKGNNGPTTAPTAHLSNVIAQVRYDDPSRTLKLARRIPLTHLARMDVGPNRQYLGMHFLSDASGADKPPINQNVRRVSGIGVEGSLKSGGGGASRQLNRKDSSMSLGAGGQNPLPGIRSLVFLSRDRNATTMVLDSLVPVLYEMQPKGGKFNIKGVDGKVRIVNQDVEWSLSALREKVLLRAGGAKHVVLNEVDVDGRVDWRDVVAKRKQLQVQENAVPEKKSWFSELLGTPLSSGSSSSRASIDATNVAPVPVPKTIIHDDDCDSATSSSVVLDKVNFEFLKLYLLVGWIVPHKSVVSAVPASSSKKPPPASLSVTVNSVSLIATSDYIYLTQERFDVWPPPLFPMSTHPAAHVNAPLLDHAASSYSAQPRTPSPSEANSSSSPSASSQTQPPPDPFKNLSSPSIPQYSPPLRIGRTRSLLRCERWKTWRWKLGPTVTQVEEAPPLEQRVASLIQNGAIGVVKVVEGEWPIGGSGVDAKQQPLRRAGATCGWDWWVRVVFRDDDDMEGGNGQEYFWDLVFATLDAANEFLEFVKAVRGVKPCHETEADVVSGHGGGGVGGISRGMGMDGEMEERDEHMSEEHDIGMEGELEEVEFARDSRLFDKVAWDGVELLIGDD